MAKEIADAVAFMIAIKISNNSSLALIEGRKQTAQNRQIDVKELLRGINSTSELIEAAKEAEAAYEKVQQLAKARTH